MSNTDELTADQIATLKTRAAKWRQQALPYGPLHGLWDLITEAEEMAKGRTGILHGTKQEVFAILMKQEYDPKEPDARSQEIARQLRDAFSKFNEGCSNTQVDNDPPESCPECAEAFVEAVRRIVTASN